MPLLMRSHVDCVSRLLSFADSFALVPVSPAHALHPQTLQFILLLNIVISILLDAFQVNSVLSLMPVAAALLRHDHSASNVRVCSPMYMLGESSRRSDRSCPFV